MRLQPRVFFLILLIGQFAAASSLRAGSLNDVVLEQIRQMPTGGQYSASHFATIRLESAAHFLVFLKTLERLRDAGLLNLDYATLTALMIHGQRDGEGIWGRWNANGPGTARLFYELGLGRNFTDFQEAQPGDFMKIFWNSEVGKLEHGHSVVYLGTEKRDGVDYVRFWSSNIPGGYGEKSVPRSRIVRAIFSRLETPANLPRIEQMPEMDTYLNSLQTHSSSFEEVQQKCGF